MCAGSGQIKEQQLASVDQEATVFIVSNGLLRSAPSHEQNSGLFNADVETLFREITAVVLV